MKKKWAAHALISVLLLGYVALMFLAFIWHQPTNTAHLMIMSPRQVQVGDRFHVCLMGDRGDKTIITNSDNVDLPSNLHVLPPHCFTATADYSGPARLSAYLMRGNVIAAHTTKSFTIYH